MAYRTLTVRHMVFLDWSGTLTVGSGASKWVHTNEFTLNYDPSKTSVTNFKMRFTVNPHNMWTGFTIRVNGIELAHGAWDIVLNAITGEATLSPAPGKYVVEFEGWKALWPYLFDAIFDYRIILEADVEGLIGVEKPTTPEDIMKYVLYAVVACLALYGVSLFITAVKRR
jgi:hypothetical protein